MRRLPPRPPRPRRARSARRHERTRMTGFLGIWSDVAPQDETDYLHWLTREHTEERLGVPGFLNVRVFRARSAEHRRYFILYGLESPDVMASAPYLARL